MAFKLKNGFITQSKHKQNHDLYIVQSQCSICQYC